LKLNCEIKKRLASEDGGLQSLYEGWWIRVAYQGKAGSKYSFFNQKNGY
jgi:hypothetical protein